MNKVYKKLLAICLGVALVVVGFVVFQPDSANAGTGHNISGWAWSDNIGWISFNSANPESPSGFDWGVNKASNGNLSGYAWSDNIGWISFNETTGCPVSPCQPKIANGSGKMTGWARAVAGIGRTDGWDGWISLGTQSGESVVYGPTLNTSTKKVEGFNWGSSVVGWLTLSLPTSGGVEWDDICILNPSDPSCPNSILGKPNVTTICLESGGSPAIRVDVSPWVTGATNVKYYRGTSISNVTTQIASVNYPGLTRYIDVPIVDDGRTYYYKAVVTDGTNSNTSDIKSQSCGTPACVPAPTGPINCNWGYCGEVTPGQQQGTNCVQDNGCGGVINVGNQTRTCTGTVNAPTVDMVVKPLGRPNSLYGPSATLTLNDLDGFDDVTIKTTVTTNTAGAVTTCSTQTSPTGTIQNKGPVGSTWDSISVGEGIDITNDVNITSPDGRTFTMSLTCTSRKDGVSSAPTVDRVQVEARKTNPF